MDPYSAFLQMGMGGIQMMAANQNQPPPNALNGINGINTGAYQPYLQQIMASGFNPQAQQYQNTSQMANAQLKNSLANRGVLNSSAGDMAIAGLNTNLANSYITNLMGRQQAALQAQTGFLVPATNTNIALGQANNQQGWNTFSGNQSNTQGMIGGLANIGKGVGGYMGNNNTASGQNGANSLTQDQYNQLMNYMMSQNNYMSSGGGNPFAGSNPYSSPSSSGSSQYSLSL